MNSTVLRRKCANIQIFQREIQIRSYIRMVHTNELLPSQCMSSAFLNHLKVS